MDEVSVYNYRDAVTDDIFYAIEHQGYYARLEAGEWENYEDFICTLYAELFAQDEITGSLSDCYYVSASCPLSEADAIHCLEYNGELSAEALQYFCLMHRHTYRGPQWLDSLIRCYLLEECMLDAVSLLALDSFFQPDRRCRA